MGVALAQATFTKGQMPVYSNVSATPGANWSNLLEEQLKSPVRWTETVQNMTKDGFDTYIECGHGSVLTGLLKRTAPDALGLAASDPASVRAAIEAVKERRT
jgi:[acyl-carrier-protein] S-malonyltransferase